jgi:hypothetical protein
MNAKFSSHHRSGAGLVTVLLAVLAVLAGCSIATPADDPDATQISPVPSTGSEVGWVRVVLRFGDEVATATLTDTPAARSFAAMLPLDLDLRDPMGQAKSGPLPRLVDVGGAEPVVDPRMGELYYWAPSNTFAILYDDLDQSVPPPGLIRLGVVDSGLDALGATGNHLPIRVEWAGGTVTLPGG